MLNDLFYLFLLYNILIISFLSFLNQRKRKEKERNERKLKNYIFRLNFDLYVVNDVLIVKEVYEKKKKIINTSFKL